MNAPPPVPADLARLLRRGFALEYLTLGWNVAGVAVLAAAAIAALAYGKARTGAALGSPVLSAEGHVTLVDAVLAGAVLTGLVLNAAAGWWWADPLAGYVLVFYAVREVHGLLTGRH
ncbi:hypothetical protein AB0L00_40015 [Actinoallomurus sp. NPDC052308]|uniref:hypothetical protein n=1 Tax=Actinoallomurus sp. NPDC052308 TaxID=3155530 RepID=UPI00341CB4AD